MPFFKNFTPTIRITVVAVFVLTTTLTATLAIGLQYYFGRSLATEAAQDLYITASAAIASEIRGIGTRNTNIISLLADNPALAKGQDQDIQRHVFSQVMLNNPLLYGVYLGHGDGSFYELINLNASNEARKSLHALPSDRWLVVSVDSTKATRIRTFFYYNENFELRTQRSEPTDFDATSRSWYQHAMESNHATRSDPYLFAQLKQAGQTVSIRQGHSTTVIGIDTTLGSISHFLANQSVSEYGKVFLYNSDGEIVASNVGAHVGNKTVPAPPFQLSEKEKTFVASQPTLRVSNEMNWPPFDYALAGQPQGYSIDVFHLITQLTGLQFEFVNGFTWDELTKQFLTGQIDILHSVLLTDENKAWGLASESYADVHYALATQQGRTPISTLNQLTGKTLAIPTGWSVIPGIRQHFPNIEIVEADSTLDALRKVLSGEVYAALDNEIILRHVASHYFLVGLEYHSSPEFGSAEAPGSLHIVAPADKPALHALINRVIAAIDEPQRDFLTRQWLDFEKDGGIPQTGRVPNTLADIAANPDTQDQLIQTRLEGNAYFVYGTTLASAHKTPLFFGVMVPEESVVGPFMKRVMLSIAITSGFLLLMLPLSWFFASPIVKPIKQLALENDKVRRREYDDVRRVVSKVKELDELSESMVEMVSAIQAHELAQRELMDSFIQLIAQAIDDKSPYTGGHCLRVPEIAMMLAKEASESNLNAFAAFKLDTDDQWREYRIAAWLHDCGKITTPEHIVDKGSKLETIYNRFHEVRMRFEVLRRDAQIDYLEQSKAQPDCEAELTAALEQDIQKLNEDYAFVANCNVGGEFLDPEKQTRLREIGSKIWQRYFDDRLGLSPVEEMRLQGDGSPLPANELLLSDKPEHIIQRTHSTDYPPEYGINMDIPEHLYNQGEIYNLSISRGTLTAEDRFKINEHMISTIKMLESLPFPEELKNVPRYASTHHETMKGSGYPRKLPGDQLSIPERILAVADIFEALTASDRPYKKAKPVSIAIDILHKMVIDQHIDKDCFELFIKSGVYKKYADEHLTAEQNDEVDIAKYLDVA